MYIDTHAHLYANDFSDDSAHMINRAIEAGVERIILPNIDETSVEPMLNLTAQYPCHLFPLIGLHPTSVNSNYLCQLRTIESWLKEKSFYGIGETGIDLYWDKTFLQEQIDSFKIQLSWARDLNIPVVIHVRNSFDETIEAIEKMQDGRLQGVFHCFTGTHNEALRIIDLGFHLGIGGVVTFKNSTLTQFLSGIDLNRILLETDAPYLAPAPFRGRRNESSYLTHIALKVSEIYGLPLEEIARQTTSNAELLFRLETQNPVK